MSYSGKVVQEEMAPEPGTQEAGSGFTEYRTSLANISSVMTVGSM